MSATAPKIPLLLRREATYLPYDKSRSFFQCNSSNYIDGQTFVCAFATFDAYTSNEAGFPIVVRFEEHDAVIDFDVNKNTFCIKAAREML